MKKVGIILVNYKDYVNRFLQECQDSLEAQTYPRDLFNVYIVDNAASDESNRYIKEHYPQAKIIPRPDGNYSAANNAGFKQALRDGCYYFVIANMDTKFDKDWLSELVKAYESHENVGVVQSMIYLYPKESQEWLNPQINTLGNEMNFLGFGFTNGYKLHKNDVELKDGQEITGYASGCSFLCSKELLSQIGGYDEEFYMYHDDVEFSWRTKLTGKKIILAPKSIVYHKYEFSRSVRMIYYMERNRYLSLFIYYKWQTLFLALLPLIAMDLGMWGYSIINKWFGTKVKVSLYFLKISTWKHIFEQRKKIKKIRKVKDKDIVKSFSGKVLFQEIENWLLNKVVNPSFDLYWKLVKKLIIW